MSLNTRFHLPLRVHINSFNDWSYSIVSSDVFLVSPHDSKPFSTISLFWSECSINYSIVLSTLHAIYIVSQYYYENQSLIYIYYHTLQYFSHWIHLENCNTCTLVTHRKMRGTSMGRNKFTRNIGVLSLYMAVQSIGKGRNAQKHSLDPWCCLP